MFPTIILLILIIILCICYILFKRNFNHWTRYPQIPSIKDGMFSGKFLDILTFKTNFGFHLRNIYKEEKFKNEAVVGIYGVYKPGLLIREPNIIKSILIKDFDCFNRHSCQADDHNDPMGALNLFFNTDYAAWKEMRQKLSIAFSTGKMKFMYPLLQKVGTRLEDYLQQKGKCFTLELKEASGRYTTDVISTTLMGFNSNALKNEQEEIYKETVKLALFNLKRAFDFLIVFFAPKLNRIFRPKIFLQSTEQFIRSSMKCVMQERERTGGKRNDLIDAFVKIKNEAKSKNLNVPQCMESLIAQACLLMLGGFETSAATISYALFELAKNPNEQHKLRKEILLALAQGKGEASYESLNKMEYLKMVIDEVLRLYPVLTYLDRQYAPPSSRNFQFSLKPYYDYKLPSGMPVYLSVFGLHYDPKYWPNPTKFYPERFSPAKRKLMNPMTYLPFGDGPRHCIGTRLGLLEAKVGLVHFLKNHSVQVCEETIIPPTFDPKSFLLQTKHGIHVKFVRDDMFENFNFTE